jgi:uncharacterized protein Yka (UPF0111/DUF47 family)
VPLRRPPIDRTLADLLEESGRNVKRAAVLLRDLVGGFPERGGLARELERAEDEGDRIAHEIFRRLAAGRRLRAPFSVGEGHALVTALDDIVDYAEEVASELTLYRVEAPMEQTMELTEVLVGAAEQIVAALRCMRTQADPAPYLIEIHRLENEGDRIERDALASLFAGGVDPILIIRWKDIVGSLEAAVDACERVAHILEGIALRRRRGSVL